jgi:hypothetical protein
MRAVLGATGNPFIVSLINGVTAAGRNHTVQTETGKDHSRSGSGSPARLRRHRCKGPGSSKVGNDRADSAGRPGHAGETAPQAVVTSSRLPGG